MDCNEKDKCESYFLHLSNGDLKELQDKMPSEENFEKLSDFFKMFSDSTRIKILHTLSKKELCVCDLAEILSMTDSAISHQLRVLKASRLVKSRREGKSVFYSLDDKHVELVITQGFEHINHN